MQQVTNNTHAIDKLRDVVKYFDQRNETINQRFKSIGDLLACYEYEMKHDVPNMISQDERLYHAEYFNWFIGYKVYSTNQSEHNGKVSKPTPR